MDYSDALDSLRKEKKVLSEFIQKNHPNYYALRRHPDLPNLAEFQSHLSEKQSLLNYYIGANFIMVAQINNKEIVNYRIEKPASLSKDIATIYQNIYVNPESSEYTDSMANGLISQLKNYYQYCIYLS